MPIGEIKTPASQRGIWFWLFVVFVVPLALIGLLGIGFVVYVVLHEFMG